MRCHPFWVSQKTWGFATEFEVLTSPPINNSSPLPKKGGKRAKSVFSWCFCKSRFSLKKRLFPGVPFFGSPLFRQEITPNPKENVIPGSSRRVTIQLWQSTQVTPSQLWPSAHWVQGTPGIFEFRRFFGVTNFFYIKLSTIPGCDG